MMHPHIHITVLWKQEIIFPNLFKLGRPALVGKTGKQRMGGGANSIVVGSGYVSIQR